MLNHYFFSFFHLWQQFSLPRVFKACCGMLLDCPGEQYPPIKCPLGISGENSEVFVPILRLENDTPSMKAHPLSLSLTSARGKTKMRHPSPTDQSPSCVRTSFPLTQIPTSQAADSAGERVAGIGDALPFWFLAVDLPFPDCHLPELIVVCQKVGSNRSKEHLLL